MSVIEVSATETKALLEAHEVVLLDVRTEAEYELANVAGAVFIPMHELTQRVEELDPKRPTVVMCHHGMRSYQVALFLNSLEFASVANLAGGIDAWSLTVDQTVPRY